MNICPFFALATSKREVKNAKRHKQSSGLPTGGLPARWLSKPGYMNPIGVEARAWADPGVAGEPGSPRQRLETDVMQPACRVGLGLITLITTDGWLRILEI